MKIPERFFHRLEETVSRWKFFYRFLRKCKVKYQQLKYHILKRRNNYIDLVYDKDFFDKNLEWNIPIAEKMTEMIIKHFNPQSVVDVGCGNAEFFAQFQKKNINIKGYEGSRHAINNSLVDREFVESFDLRNRIFSDKKYDLALCLEVAEHIEKKCSQTLVDSLTGLSDWVIFTTAKPGQGGHFHINEQPENFWIEKFQAQGFAYQAKISQAIKEQAKENNILSWYSDNFMVFKKSKN